MKLCIVLAALVISYAPAQARAQAARPVVSSQTAAYAVTGPGIRNPAEYRLPGVGHVSLVVAVVRAGGFSPEAITKDVCVCRRLADGTMTMLQVDARTPGAMSGFQMQDGDVVTVSAHHPPWGGDPLEALSGLWWTAFRLSTSYALPAPGGR